MPSLPPSPLKTSRRRSQDQSQGPVSAASAANGFSQSPPVSPRSPRSSVPASPVTPRQNNAQIMNAQHRGSGDFSGAGDGGGLGSLADELADAWEEEGGYEYASGQENGAADSHPLDQSEGEGDYMHTHTRSPSSTASVEPSKLHPPKHKGRNGAHRHHRRQESHYDGSDYGNDSDLENTDMSPSLETQMADIEHLARRGMENNGSDSDHIIKRAVEALRDLGLQSGIENNAMRLITAHTSIASHLTHQTRALQTLTHPLLFSPFPILSADAIDSLFPLIDEGLLQNLPLPFPTHSPSTPANGSQSTSLNSLVSLQTLISQTYDLTHTLRGLGDTLYESRQLTSTASRRLRSARELVAELRREEEGREEGSRWIERGNWDRRLQEREAGRVCGEVVSGFEAICGEWRERLFGAAGAEIAAA